MTKTKKLVLAALFLALGLLIPSIFHMSGLPGNVFLPMHIPVLLCGFVLGEKYGALIGFVTPFLSSILTGMPPIYPVAVAMAFELATYGFVSGYLYKRRKMNVFVSLVIAMLLGRLVSGAANYILLTSMGKKYVLNMFITASFVKCIWGIVIQLILIPFVVKMIYKYNLV
ncbi:ECF transporter S component [Thermobrachium celere]|uniref:ECF transporter S component n=1 Tax=Thermobrachium celere TaxID=53422 RepID=UPI001945441B|nr:ECF transporter S component [Thermobrachium celere]GFR36365.1 membrane protein [Thermobrachium celere]